MRAATTLLLSLPFTLTSMTNRDVRSTNVAMWVFLVPLSKSFRRLTRPHLRPRSRSIPNGRESPDPQSLRAYPESRWHQ